MSYLADLNPKQKEAVEAGDGPLLIIAGPGTGKTKTLSARIVHLVQTGKARPSQILALTFTNKAAREMQERVRVQLPGKAPTITTFHALAHSLLKAEKITLVDSQTQAEIIRAIKKTHAKQLSQRDVGLLISNAKNALRTSEDASLSLLVETYNGELSKRGLWDFDDLLLRLHEQLSAQTNTSYTHILVDEFQDTNDLQYDLLKLLNATDNLFVIGDPLQAIYGFRGASEGIFERFQTDWPTTHKIQLSVNYRSVPEVVAASNAIFTESPPLTAYRDAKGVAQTVEVLNEYGEADWVVAQIERQIGGSDLMRTSRYDQYDKQRCFSDFAVLYRTHAAAKTLQRVLEASGIPYQVAGEGSPYMQPHIQELLQAMAYIVGRSGRVGKLSEAQTHQLLNPLRMQKLTPLQCAGKLSTVLGLDTERTHSSLGQFMSTLARFDDLSLEAYLDHVEELAEQEYYDPSADAVALLTIHAAKGLEFSQVFLLATEEGIVPLARPGQTVDMAEEKRLFYVAATRARDGLFLLHARKRSKEARELSQFAKALPPSVLERTSDPEMVTQIRKLKRREQKRSQGSLF